MSVTFTAYVPSDLDPDLYEIQASGPNLSNHNAYMVLESLGYTYHEIQHGWLDVTEFRDRLVLARAVGGTIADDGIADVVSAKGRSILCGVRPGYFADRYEQLAELAEKAVGGGADHIGFC